MSGFVTALVQLWLELPALLGYLKGQTFYKPLSREEEEEVINRFIKGDESARVELIERNMRLVAHVVKNSILHTICLMIIFQLARLVL